MKIILFIELAFIFLSAYQQQQASALNLDDLKVLSQEFVSVFNPSKFNKISLEQIIDSNASAKASLTLKNILADCNQFHDEKLTISAKSEFRQIIFSNGASPFSFISDYSLTNETGTYTGTLKGFFHFDEMNLTRSSEIAGPENEKTLKHSVINLVWDLHYFNLTTLTPENDFIKEWALKLFNNETYKKKQALSLSYTAMDKIQEYYDSAKEETIFYFPYKNDVIKYSLNLEQYVLKDNYQLNYSSFNIIDFTNIDTINLNITTVDEVTTPLKYYSRSVFNNTLNYALQKNLLDNKLDSSWSSKYFDFFIGDIALAIPSVRYKYYSNEKVIGECIAKDKANFKFDDQTGGGEISLDISYKCTISAEKDKKLIITFDIVPIITVNPVLNKDSLEFIVSKTGLRKDPVFTPEADFPLTNQNLAKDFINDGIQNLIGQTVFNGFPVDYRKVPGTHMESDYLILFQARC